MTGFGYSNLLDLLGCFVTLSLLSVGGAITTVPEMHRFLVAQNAWLTDSQFSASIALAQAAPGPNFMTVTLLGWHIYGVIGALVATFAIAWPSSILIFYLQRLIMGIKDPLKKKSIQYAAAALAIGLVLSSAWQISLQINQSVAAYILTMTTIAITFFTRWHPL